MILYVFLFFPLINAQYFDCLDSTQSISTAQFDCLDNIQSNKYNWFIARLYTSAGQDYTGSDNLLSYISVIGNNPNIQLTVYISPCVTGSCQSPQNQIISAYNTLNSIISYAFNTGTIPMVYVDINKLTWSSNVTFNQNFLRQMVYQSTSINSTTTIGIYTNQQDWEAVFGPGWNEFSSLPLWWNSRGDVSLNGFLPFGGWTIYNVVLRQYGINYSACGINFNANFAPVAPSILSP